MRAFRIGRKPPGPWANMTPPIRGGVFYKDETPPTPLSDDDVDSDDSSGKTSVSSLTTITALCSSVESLDKLVPSAAEPSLRRRDASGSTPALDASLPLNKLEGVASTRLLRYPLNPYKLTNLAIEKEIDRDLQSYPSVDPAVQQDITRSYQLLHQRVQDSGLYDCPYLEYGYEAMRYVTLFSLFILTLRPGWYLVSAAILGLFWVGIQLLCHCLICN